MPLNRPNSQSADPRYCTMCFQNGELCYKGNDLKEFQAQAYKGMREDGMNIFKAKLFTYTIRFAPRWKKYVSKNESL